MGVAGGLSRSAKQVSTSNEGDDLNPRCFQNKSLENSSLITFDKLFVVLLNWNHLCSFINVMKPILQWKQNSEVDIRAEGQKLKLNLLGDLLKKENGKLMNSSLLSSSFVSSSLSPSHYLPLTFLYPSLPPDRTRCQNELTVPVLGETPGLPKCQNVLETTTFTAHVPMFCVPPIHFVHL